jgi:hypothetical protein
MPSAEENHGVKDYCFSLINLFCGIFSQNAQYCTRSGIREDSRMSLSSESHKQIPRRDAPSE